MDKWVHNTETWLFDTPEAAWSVVPAEEEERYRLYAYRLLPVLNRYCLVDDLDTAEPMARHFATDNCEPGAYCVVEVWRREP